jgi:catechol 2,3-dioxygenase-like lactoylglutathione lyase family enzyme
VPRAHVGRLLDHVHLRARDLAASRRFYAAAAEALGSGAEVREGDGWFSVDELFVSDDREPAGTVHIAFQAPDRETVKRFHRAVLGAGGRDNGAPGERAYHPGYYAAYALDPDGNNVEAVHHGPAGRSAPSVVLEWEAS